MLQGGLCDPRSGSPRIPSAGWEGLCFCSPPVGPGDCARRRPPGGGRLSAAPCVSERVVPAAGVQEVGAGGHCGSLRGLPGDAHAARCPKTQPHSLALLALKGRPGGQGTLP